MSELLVALGVLGIIAAFSIPKVLYASRSVEYNAKAKEAASTISQAYQLYKMDNNPTAATRVADFVSYFNHVGLDSTTVIDDHPPWGTIQCGFGTRRCLKLHNGAILAYRDDEAFGATTGDRGLWFGVDPDGKASDSEGVTLFLLFNGRVINNGINVGYISSTIDGYPTNNPPPAWFHWN